MASRLSRKKEPRSTRRPPSILGSAIFAVFAVASSCVVVAQAPDRARTEALARRATERMQALQRDADRLASEERTLIGDLRKVEIDRQLKAEQLKQIDNEAGSVQTELETTARHMETLK